MNGYCTMLDSESGEKHTVSEEGRHPLGPKALRIAGLDVAVNTKPASTERLCDPFTISHNCPPLHFGEIPPNLDSNWA